MFFSVIVPLFNKSYSIIRCVDSVLSQSHFDFELIVVDDGSTDNSLNVLKMRYKTYISTGKIKIVEQSNQGVSVARNSGVMLASYQYICFLDADDEWGIDFLRLMNQLVVDYPEADLYCLAHKVSKAGKVAIQVKHGLPYGFRGYVSDFFRSSAKGSVANSSKVCVKKESFLKVGGFPEGVVAGEDLFLWIKLALNGSVACHVKEAVTVHTEKDHSRLVRKNSVPYPIVHFAEIDRIPKDSSLNHYLFRIFYKHFLSSLFGFRLKEAWFRVYFYLKIYIQ